MITNSKLSCEKENNFMEGVIKQNNEYYRIITKAACNTKSDVKCSNNKSIINIKEKKDDRGN